MEGLPWWDGLMMTVWINTVRLMQKKKRESVCRSEFGKDFGGNEIESLVNGGTHGRNHIKYWWTSGGYHKDASII